jgi:hypothetical protein
MTDGIISEGKSENLVKSSEEIDAEVRMRNCWIDIQKILKRWNCKINPVVSISGAQGLNIGFNIVPLENKIVG